MFVIDAVFLQLNCTFFVSHHANFEQFHMHKKLCDIKICKFLLPQIFLPRFFGVATAEHFGHKQKQNAQFLKSFTKDIFRKYLTQFMYFYSLIPMIGHNFLLTKYFLQKVKKHKNIDIFSSCSPRRSVK